MVSDLVRSGELPASLRQSAEAYAGCIGGAEHQDRYLALIEAAGFRDVRVVGAEHYLYAAAGVSIVSLQVTATKG